MKYEEFTFRGRWWWTEVRCPELVAKLVVVAQIRQLRIPTFTKYFIPDTNKKYSSRIRFFI